MEKTTVEKTAPEPLPPDICSRCHHERFRHDRDGKCYAALERPDAPPVVTEWDPAGRRPLCPCSCFESVEARRREDAAKCTCGHSLEDHNADTMLCTWRTADAAFGARCMNCQGFRANRGSR